MHYSWAVSITAEEANSEENEKNEKSALKESKVNDAPGNKIRATRVRCNRLYNVYVGMFYLNILPVKFSV